MKSDDQHDKISTNYARIETNITMKKGHMLQKVKDPYENDPDYKKKQKERRTWTH